MKQILYGVRDLSPYLLVLLLPGGSLIALAMWLFRRQKSFRLTRHTNWDKVLKAVGLQPN